MRSENGAVLPSRCEQPKVKLQCGKVDNCTSLIWEGESRAEQLAIGLGVCSQQPQTWDETSASIIPPLSIGR
jgi:hypothetical protein